MVGNNFFTTPLSHMNNSGFCFCPSAAEGQKHAAHDVHHVHLCSVLQANNLSSLNTRPLSSTVPARIFCTVGFHSLTFCNTLKCRHSDLVWPDHRMAFLPL